jgi:glycine betaine/proline transport system substrate-binding protein
MRKTLCGVSAATLAFTITVGAAAAETVTIGVPNWAYAKVISNVVKIISEEQLGTQVGMVPSTNPVTFKAMDRGKGDIDVHPDVWMPNQQNLTAEYVDKKNTVHLSNKPYSAIQGVCTFKSTQDKHGIKSVYDLTNPDNAKLFDSNGDGKGEIWVGAPGWASTNVEKVKARDYGYDEFFELDVIEETLVLSQIDAAAKKGANMVFFCYAPHHIFNMHEIVLLEEPDYESSKWNMVQPTDDPDWYNKSSVAVAWPPTTVHIAYSKTLEDRAPQVAQLLRNIQFDTDLISSWSYAMAVENKDATEFAKEWVDANPEKVNQWLGL